MISERLEWQDAEYALCFDADGYYYRIDMSKLTKKHPRLVYPTMLIKCNFINQNEYDKALDFVDRYEEECLEGWDDACEMLEVLKKFQDIYQNSVTP